MASPLRIDSHHHFWKLNRGDYHWLSDELPEINHDFLSDALAPLLSACNIDKTIVVQAAETTNESDFLFQLAEKTEFIAGIVAWVNMNTPHDLNVLERWKNNPYFVGIRPVMQDMADIDWMLNPELAQYFEWLVEHDFSFDALVKPHLLENLIILIDRYPTLRVVIDHGAKPYIATNDIEPWATQMTALGAKSNVYCKLSGLVTEAGKNLSYETLKPYMTHLLEAFGSKKLMWGSDWPVCNLASTYQQWVSLSDQFLNRLDEQDQMNIRGETALAFYKPRAINSLHQSLTNRQPI